MTDRREGLLRGATLSGALLFVGLGLWLTIQPEAVQDLYPIGLNAPMAVSEIRAIFGGLMTGIGVAVLLLDLVYQRQRDAAMVLATIFGSLVLARIVGLIAEGFPNGMVLTEAVFEFVFLALLVGLGAFRRSS